MSTQEVLPKKKEVGVGGLPIRKCELTHGELKEKNETEAMGKKGSGSERRWSRTRGNLGKAGRFSFHVHVHFAG